MANLARPTGPRDFQRSPSPAPPAFALPSTEPLNLRIRQQQQQPSPTPSVNGFVSDPSPSPSNMHGGLYVPQVGRSRARPSTPRLNISPALAVSRPNANNRASNDSDSPPYGDYYIGGPRLQVITNPVNEGGDQPTIRPPASSGSATMVPGGAPLDDVSSIRTAITQISEVSKEEVRAPVYGEEKWSDDFLEDLERLGEGAGGAVHKVRDKRNNVVMARKTITTRETPPKQLVRELSFMSTTVHKNICRFYGAYISPSSSEVKVLMEICEGKSLEAIEKKIKTSGRYVSEKVIGRVAEGIFEGLAYLHSRKIVHRDIKPSNILVTREGVVKLCDFGVSGDLVDSLAGTFTGTSFYMAPERISGQQYTIRSDVWSAGISLLEFITQKFPFPNDIGPIDLIFYITQCDPPRLEDDEGVKWTDELKHFIKQTLTVSSTERPTPSEMLEHPYLVEIMKKEVPMGVWISQVWGWKKNRRDGYSHVRLSPRKTALTVTTPTTPQALTPKLKSPENRGGWLPCERLPSPNGQLKGSPSQFLQHIDVVARRPPPPPPPRSVYRLPARRIAPRPLQVDSTVVG